MEPLFKSIMGWVDYHIDQDPLRETLILNEAQSVSFLGSMKQLYTEGRLRYTENGYQYRGVTLILERNIQYLAG